LWGVGGFFIKSAPIEENYDEDIWFEEVFGFSNLASLYKRDLEELMFIWENGWGFKTSEVLFDDDIDLNIFSDYAILVNLTTNEVIFERNADLKAYPASLTKIMTVLVALEHGSQETMKVNVDFNELAAANAAIAGFRNGEELSKMDLLMGTMLPSGADASLTLAHHIAGSEAAFVELMNEKAAALGMTETHFMNVTGLHHAEHYTTARDMAILVKMAIRNPEFREIFSAEFYETETGIPLSFRSRMFERMDSPVFEGGQILGGKTGYTWEALLCLASIATDGEHEYALITMHADGDPTPVHQDLSNTISDTPSRPTQEYHVLDALQIYHYFFNN